MNQNDHTKSGESDLRSKALRVLASRSTETVKSSSLSEQDISALIHELQVHQIELELQNEELRASELTLQEAHDRLLELYDFAPVGYLTVNSTGLILKANLTAAFMLGAERNAILKRPLSRLIYNQDADIFYLGLKTAFLSNQKQTCELRFEKVNGSLFHAQLECIVLPDEDGNLPSAKIIMVDISSRKQAEALLERQRALTDSMHVLSMNVMAADSATEIAGLALEEAQKLTDSEIGFAGYIDPITGHLVCPAFSHGVWEKCRVKNKLMVFETFSGLWGWGLNNKTGVLSNAPSKDLRSGGTPSGHVPIHRVICAPAMDGANLIGQIAVANSSRDYTLDDMVSIQRLSAIYSLGIQRRLAEESKTKLISDLEKAFSEIKTLRGFIPICASCKKIRDDKGFWQAVEVYIQDRTDAQFSHGLCPDCARKLYPECFERDPKSEESPSSD